MMIRCCLLLLAITGLLPSFAVAAPPVGQPLPKVTISGKDGGRVDGKPWSSDEFQGTMQIVFYIDPDERALNDPLTYALQGQEFPKEHFRSVAIINMAATWLPNAAIASNLKKKQEEFPLTVYVKDLRRIMVQKWQLADDNNDVVLVDRDGKVIFAKDGKLSDAEVAQVIQLIRERLPAPVPN